MITLKPGDFHKASVQQYQAERRKLQAAVKKSMLGFAFTPEWPNKPDGLWLLLRHCKQNLRAEGVLRGPSLSALNYVINGVEDVMVGKERALPWVQFIDSLKGQGHLALDTPPSSMNAFFAVFLRFPLDSRSWYLSVKYSQPHSPWQRLKPCSDEGLKLLEAVIREFLDE